MKAPSTSSPRTGRLARLQQALIVALGVLALAGAAVAVRADRPGLAAAWVCAVLGLNAALLGLEFLLQPLFNRGDPAPAPTTLQRLRAWAAEVRQSTQVFGWRQPWRSGAVPDTPLSDPGLQGRRGAVLVHGFVCNRGLWTPALQRLRVQGVPFIAVNLEPVFGSIDAHDQTLDGAVSALTAATGQAPLIVAHSMGGLAVRAWMRACRARGQAPQARVRGVVTIATPHHGTVLASFALAPNAVQMRRGSRWLADLADSETPASRAVFTCFYSPCDNIVAPASSATLVGADNRLIAGCAHVELAQHPAVWAEVDRLLAASPIGPAQAAQSAVDNAPHARMAE